MSAVVAVPTAAAVTEPAPSATSLALLAVAPLPMATEETPVDTASGPMAVELTPVGVESASTELVWKYLMPAPPLTLVLSDARAEPTSLKVVAPMT